MVVNRENRNETEHVKFVSYDGKYPCLCYGQLVMEIDGKEYYFGYGYHGEDERDLEPFWSPGGCVEGDGEGGIVVKEDEWRIDSNILPEHLRKYVDEIDREFNDNVPYGCCGGCA